MTGLTFALVTVLVSFHGAISTPIGDTGKRFEDRATCAAAAADLLLDTKIIVDRNDDPLAFTAYGCVPWVDPAPGDDGKAHNGKRGS